MDKIKNIKNIIINYPKISNIIYNISNSYWKIKAKTIDYEYPNDLNNATISFDRVKDYNSNRITGPKKRICYAPFNNLHFSINGTVSMCSYNQSSYIGNINKEPLHNIWFGKKSNKFRENLANYNFGKCQNCQFVLESGNYNAFPANKYDLHSSDDNIYPTQMSFEISNLCNLECIMCNGMYSSLIRKNREHLPPVQNNYPDNFIEQLNEFIPHLKIATFIGGEPLIIKEYYKIWESIIALNRNCTIHIQTNATVIPEKFINLLNTGQFDIGISIDAVTKEKYEAIRINANFEQVFYNIEKLLNFRKRKNIFFNLNFCVMTNNWEELPLFIEYANKRNLSVKIININRPYHLSLENQSGEFVKDVYNNLIETTFKSFSDIIAKKNIKSFFDFLKELKKVQELTVEKELFLNKFSVKDLHEIILLYIENVKDSFFVSKLLPQEINIFINNSITYIKSISNIQDIQKQLFLVHLYNIHNSKKEKVFIMKIEELMDLFKQISDSALIQILKR